LGDKDVEISELQKKSSDTRRRLKTERNKTKRLINELKENYEEKLMEVQKQHTDTDPGKM